MSSSKLQIGPAVTLDHQVQDIDITESRNVFSPQLVRSKNTVAIEKGTSKQVARVQLLFTGQEINEDLTLLYATFRACPIISIENEAISGAWLDTTSISSKVPVALTSITVRNVPDIPESVLVLLEMVRVDLSPIYGINEIFYVTENGDKSYKLEDATPLSKWLYELAKEKNYVSPEKFGDVRMYWEFLNLENNQLAKDIGERYVFFEFNEGDPDTVLSESVSIRNYFGFQNYVGSSAPLPQYMGSSNRTYSLEVQFTTPAGYDKFSRKKEEADKKIRSIDISTRISGINIHSQLAEILKDKTKNFISESRLFVPLNNKVELTEVPDLKKFRSDMIEVKLSDFTSSQAVTSDGGTDYSNLKRFFRYLFTQDYEYRLGMNRANFTIDPENIEDLIKFRAHQVVWPYKSTSDTQLDRLSPTHLFGLINRDTLKAAILELDNRNDRLITKALQDNTVITGKAITGPTGPTTIQKIEHNALPLRVGLFGLPDNDPRLQAVYKIVRNIVHTLVIVNTHNRIDGPNISSSLESFSDAVSVLSLKIARSFYADFNRFRDTSLESTDVIAFLASSDLAISPEFLDALFNVIVKRKGPPSNTDVFNRDGVMAAFTKLLTEYNIYLNTDRVQMVPREPNPEDYEDNRWTTSAYLKFYDTSDIIDNQKLVLEKPSLGNKTSGNCYPDIPLPTYGFLFKDKWENHALTFDDLGIINPNIVEEQGVSRDDDPQKEPIVSPDDLTHPSIFFYRGRFKDTQEDGADIYEGVFNTSDITKTALDVFSISIPFNTDQLHAIKSIIGELREGTQGGPMGGSDPSSSSPPNNQLGEEKEFYLRQTLHEIIKGAMFKAKSSSSLKHQFLEDMRSLEIMSTEERFREKFLSEDSKAPISLYLHHNNNLVIKDKVTVPMLGGEIYKVAKDLKFFKSTSELPVVADEDMKTADPSSDPEFSFVRNLKSNTEKAVTRSLNQISDDIWSPSRMFPAFKLYMIDFRGSDLVANDIMFDVSTISSIDITNDKDDAGIAVIKISDPLRFLQNSMLLSNSILDYQSTGEYGQKIDEKVVLGNLQGAQFDDYLDRYMIAQGRGIMIKMGYATDPDHLKTVFTGRIQEILPGDEITIVCQEWKAELISRQISFYNEDPNNWGARDLAIQAITNAEPQGMGHHIPQHSIDYILKGLTTLDAESTEAIRDFVGNSFENMQNVTIKQYGDRSYVDDLLNSISRTVNLSSVSKRNKGIDTRLRNIWYPDLAGDYNNLFGLRSFFTVLPSWTNDSWVVPLKPAWDVLKEAARHAWDCIVQVVPYDGRSTIFMGHPDQPYYYTQGKPISNKRWRKYKKYRNETNKEVFEESISNFLFSSEYIPETPIGFTSTWEVVLERDIRWWRRNSTQGESRTYSEMFSNLLHDTKKLRENLPGVRPEGPRPDGWDPTQEPVEAYPPSFYVTKKWLDADIFDIGVADAVNNDPKVLYAYDVLQHHWGEVIGPLLIEAVFGLPADFVHTRWPTVNHDLRDLMHPDRVIPLEAIKNKLPNIDNTTPREVFMGLLREIIRTGESREIDPQLRNTLTSFGQATPGHDRRSIIQLTEESRKLLTVYPANEHIANFVNFVNTSGVHGNSPNFAGIRDKAREILGILEDEDDSNLLQKYAELTFKGDNIRDLIINNLAYLKAFVYFYASYLDNDSEMVNKIATNTISKDNAPLSPNMKVFREHHYVSNKHNLIENNLVASVKEMWNTVVIEHPAKNEVDSVVDEDDEVFTTSRLATAIEWNYYPKKETTGVYGLQFHPGLTLQNKKIKKCTELNCYTPELAAKLACNNLAQGIRKMYRGTLIVSGTVMKAHDRIILQDDYNGMAGPVEIETIIHHFSPDMGWVSHITPEAICMTNPGAGILQTAQMETLYASLFSAIDYGTDAINIAIILATLGGGAGTTVATRSAAAALKAGIKNAVTLNLRNIAANTGRTALSVGRSFTKGGPVKISRDLIKKYGGLGKSVIKAHTALGAAELAGNIGYRFNVINSYVETADDVEQLPIILSPLIYQGRPFTAGLQTGEAVWSVFTSGFFTSAKDLRLKAQKFLEETVGIETAEINDNDVNDALEMERIIDEGSRSKIQGDDR